MGFFDDVIDFFTGDDQQTTQRNINTTTQQDVAETGIQLGTTAQTQERGAVTAEEQATATTRNELTTQLDPATQQLLQGLIQQLGGVVAGGQEDPTAQAINTLQQSFAGQFADRAAGADTALAGSINDIINAARQQGLQDVTRQNNQIAQRAGSSFNTLVQDVAQENLLNLDTQLAGLAGQLALGARESGTQEFLGANEALRRATESSRLGASSGIADLATLVNSLKGATQQSALVGDVQQTGRQETQETINSVQQVIELLQRLQEGTSITRGTESGESTDSSTIFDLLDSGLFR